VNAGKQMTIHELPSMLCVHLKRFTFDMMRGYMRKVTKDIQYTETLDMAPYVSKETKCKSAIYRLYAVLVHLGYGCDSGHYFAYVKAPDGKWFRMDDEDVSSHNTPEK
jgi:ubiquitin C-terminal hydrolase